MKWNELISRTFFKCEFLFCGNYRKLLSHFFDKKIVKATFLRKKLLKSWFHEISFAVRVNFSVFHTVCYQTLMLENPLFCQFVWVNSTHCYLGLTNPPFRELVWVISTHCYQRLGLNFFLWNCLVLIQCNLSLGFKNSHVWYWFCSKFSLHLLLSSNSWVQTGIFFGNFYRKDFKTSTQSFNWG